MKKCKKKMKMISLLLAMVLLAESFMPVMKAEAAGNPSFPKEVSGKYEPAYHGSYGITINNFPKNGKVKNLKSSNKKVVKVSWKNKREWKQYIWMEYRKAGKATVSFDVVYGKKTKHFKTKVIVTNYQNPCKSFKLGGKEYASKLKKVSHYSVNVKGKKKYKISVKAKFGWKLENIWVYDGKTGKSKRIKNNSTMTFKSDYYSISGNFRNKKTNKYETVNLNVYKQ